MEQYKKTIKYNKLTRDKNLEIVKNADWTSIVEVLDKREYLKKIKKKLAEKTKD